MNIRWQSSQWSVSADPGATDTAIVVWWEGQTYQASYPICDCLVGSPTDRALQALYRLSRTHPPLRQLYLLLLPRIRHARP